jgi:tetratricopeptide (TPR) repeat protein
LRTKTNEVAQLPHFSILTSQFCSLVRIAAVVPALTASVAFAQQLPPDPSPTPPIVSRESWLGMELGIGWKDSVKSAVAQASAEHRLILLHRRSVGNETDALDQMLAAALKTSAVVGPLRNFVLARLQTVTLDPDVWRPPTAARKDPLSVSMLSILDSHGVVLVEWRTLHTIGQLARLLSGMSENASVLLHGGDLRAEGRSADGFFYLGVGLLRSGELEEGRNVLRRSAKEARRRHDAAREQMAAVLLASASWMEGKPAEAIAPLEKIAGSAATPEVEAMAWYELGEARRVALERAAALEAYRRAARVAPAGTEVATAAANAVAQLEGQ